MSGTVRILAMLFGAALSATLYFGLDISWYLAVLAGGATLMAFPICHEFVARTRRSVHLKRIIRDARGRKGSL